MKLVTKSLASEAPVVTNEPTHRIVVVDCSGSMGSELPKLRSHLKNKLPTLVLPDDILSIVWFSSKGQFGTLFEGIQISTLQDLSKVNSAIDRFLVPIGMTGFKQPLEEVKAIIGRSSLTSHTLSFLTDGYENQSPKKEVLKACADLADSLSSATFVEYGYYADSKMVQEMAEEVGGSVVLAQDFTNYSETLASNLATKTSGKKIKVKKVTAEYVIGCLPDGFVIARPDAVGTVTLPAATLSYSYFEIPDIRDVIDTVDVESPQTAAYVVGALVQRGDMETAMKVAAAIGDVEIYSSIENAFSKQDYAAAVEVANAYGSGKKTLYSTAPKNTNLLPDENAYNVLTLLMDLAEQEGNYLDISHPEFKYNPIGSNGVTAEKADGFKPVFTDKNGQIRGAISALKFDEDRPNISILVRREGTVSLPDNEFGFGNSIESFIWRNYTIVKDGIVNLRKLPVILSNATHHLLTELGVITEPFKVNQTYVIDTKRFPVINRSMAKPVTSTEMFNSQFELYRLQVEQKYLGSKFEKPEVDSSFAAKYSEEGAKFLKEFGVGPGGFSPKKVAGVQLDPYIAKVLSIKLSGLNSIPKVEEVEKAVAAGKKLTPSQTVMAQAIEKYKDCTDFEGTWKKVREQVRETRNAIVMTKFGIILGKRWFTDMVDLDDNTREVDFGLGKVISCQAVLSDKEV